MEDIRINIEKDTLLEFREEFLSKYKKWVNHSFLFGTPIIPPTIEDNINVR
jgi:hypothetical protein